MSGVMLRAAGGGTASPGGTSERVRRKRILLVDDSRTSLFLESMILKNEPYEIVTASDGAEAVQKAAALRPDIIVMDVVMPRMTGFQACSQIRSTAGCADIPIILVTTRGEPENVEKGFECGCCDYVTKPVNGLELIAKIRDYLGE